MKSLINIILNKREIPVKRGQVVVNKMTLSGMKKIKTYSDMKKSIFERREIIYVTI